MSPSRKSFCFWIFFSRSCFCLLVSSVVGWNEDELSKSTKSPSSDTDAPSPPSLGCKEDSIPSSLLVEP
jgi:hypothetical protein